MGNFRLLFQKISFYLGSSFSTQIRQHLKISFGIFVASILITQIISIQYVTLILYFLSKKYFYAFFFEHFFRAIQAPRVNYLRCSVHFSCNNCDSEMSISLISTKSISELSTNLEITRALYDWQKFPRKTTSHAF